MEFIHELFRPFYSETGEPNNITAALIWIALIPVRQFFWLDERIGWPYLLSAALLAIAVYFFGSHADRSATRGLRGCLGYLFPRSLYLHPSSRLDYWFYVVNRIFMAFALLPILLLSEWTSAKILVLLKPFVSDKPTAISSPLAPWLYSFAILLAFDFGAYVAHYLQHRVRFLWEFHKSHHSARVLTPITVYRVHPIDDVLNTLLPTTLAGVVDGVLTALIPGAKPGITVFELNIFFFIFYLVGFNLRHSHVWLDYGRLVSRLLISPAQHQIHHSDQPKHFDRNFGYVFAFWDWIFGTLYLPHGPESLTFGLGEAENDHYNTVKRLYFVPFFKAFWRKKS